VVHQECDATCEVCRGQFLPAAAEVARLPRETAEAAKAQPASVEVGTCHAKQPRLEAGSAAPRLETGSAALATRNSRGRCACFSRDRLKWGTRCRRQVFEVDTPRKHVDMLYLRKFRTV